MASEYAGVGVGLLLLCLGVTFFIGFTSIIDIKYGEVNTEYSPIDAKIMESKVISSNNDYELIVKYEYVVNLILYQNDVFSACEEKYDTEVMAEEGLKSYQIGQVITVYYNPKNPVDSVILRGCTDTFEEVIHKTTILGVVFLTLLTLISVPYIRDYISLLTTVNKTILTNVPVKTNNFTDNQSLCGTYAISAYERVFYRIPKSFKRIVTTFVSFLFLLLLSLNGIAIIILMEGYSSISKYMAIVGYYPTPDMVYRSSLTIVFITGFISLVAVLVQINSGAEKIGYIIVFPFIYMLIGVMSVLSIMLMIPLAFGFYLFTLLLYLPLYPILENNFGLNKTENIFFFLMCLLIVIFIFNYIKIKILRPHDQYLNLIKGDKHVTFAYTNKNSELYCMAISQDYLALGDRHGNLTIINEYSQNLPDKIQLHTDSIMQVIYRDGLYYTIALDQTLKVSKIMDQHFKTLHTFTFDAVPLAIGLYNNTIYVGLSNGRVAKLIQTDTNINLLSDTRICRTPVIKILVVQKRIYVLTRKQMVVIDTQTGVETFRSLKTKEVIIDMVDYLGSIIVSTLNGKIKSFEMYNPRVSLYSKLTSDNEGFTKLFTFENTLFAGSTKGVLYKINLNTAEIENKYDVHSYWIEDIVIQDNYAYTVSSDGTLKKIDLSITESNLADVVDPIGIVFGIHSCDVCKTPINSDQRITKCFYCNSYFHTDHLSVYLVSRSSEGKKLNCSVCKSKYVDALDLSKLHGEIR